MYRVGLIVPMFINYIGTIINLYYLLYKMVRAKGFSTTALTEKTTEPIWPKFFIVIPDTMMKILVPLLS